MCRETPLSPDAARLLAARDEALRHVAEHSAAAWLKISRWNSRVRIAQRHAADAPGRQFALAGPVENPAPKKGPDTHA